jgi:hypothetical protein
VGRLYIQPPQRLFQETLRGFSHFITIASKRIILSQTIESTFSYTRSSTYLAGDVEGDEIYPQLPFQEKLRESRNPCQGRWNLVDDFTTYKHSSAAFYDCEQENNYITDYREYF